MQLSKKDREAFVEFGLEAGTYDKNYSDSPDRYPDHVFRLRIFLDLLKEIKPKSLLDAGCGTGRLAIELAHRGREVVGVDLDVDMVDRARRKAPQIDWHVADLATVQLGRTFPIVVMAGNILLFCKPEDRGAIVANLSHHLEPGGRLVAGFSLDAQGYPVERYDELCAAAGLVLEARYATWERAPFAGGDGAGADGAGGDYAVSIHRQP